MKRYVISDLHLGHKGILKYRTEFSNLEQMHSCIIENWNNVVTSQDKVYILGDVAWNKQALALLNSMNGEKVLIKGNHDILPLKEYVKYFEDNIRGVMEYKGCILTHVPVHECQLSRFKLNIHGHMHDREVQTIELVSHNFIGDSRYINVCCEQVNYTPILLENIINDNDTRHIVHEMKSLQKPITISTEFFDIVLHNDQQVTAEQMLAIRDIILQNKSYNQIIAERLKNIKENQWKNYIEKYNINTNMDDIYKLINELEGM